MGFKDKIMNIFSKNNANVFQSRKISAKLHDTHVKYATEKRDGVEVIIGRDGHLNIVDKDKFELVFGINSIFKFEIDKMAIWEFMSLDGAVITGFDLNTNTERTVTTYYDKHLT